MATDVPSTWVPRSCSTALAAPELLCRILLFLDPQDLLVNAPRVCKYWKDAIERDPELQRALFFRPWQPKSCDSRPTGPSNAAAADDDDMLNPFFTDFLSPVPESISRKDKINSSGFKGKADLCSLLDGRADPDSWRRPEASWRRMLVQQPPRDLVVLQKRTCGQPYDELRFYTAKQFRGVLMADLYHLLWSYVHTSMTQGLLEEVAAEFEESASCRGILACATRWFLLFGLGGGSNGGGGGGSGGRGGAAGSAPRSPRRVDLPDLERETVERLQARYAAGPDRPMVLTLLDRCRDCRGQCRFCGPWMARYGQPRSAEAAVRLGFDESHKGAVEMWEDYGLRHRGDCGDGGGDGGRRRRREKKMALRNQGWQTVYKADYTEDEFEYYTGALALVDLTR
ncbi:hypothetical protein VMCG_08466 [Cytospora schulzeri]|uniref:F-box domain-containing protein n=1 Tax=Cytospora schulzeri TaxID=448051 RepID=A0A423VWM7_9PEZI|nr:hypothetical protein VMCG_08466 [Valsa malicola]